MAFHVDGGASGAPTDAAPQRPPSPRGAAVGEDAGGDPSNTPPSITKCLGGEDWLEQSLYLQHRSFPQLKQRLDTAREAAESNERGLDELDIAGRKFLMLASGALAGAKQKQVVYRWRLQSEDGWWLLLMIA